MSDRLDMKLHADTQTKTPKKKKQTNEEEEREKRNGEVDRQTELGFINLTFGTNWN